MWLIESEHSVTYDVLHLWSGRVTTPCQYVTTTVMVQALTVTAASCVDQETEQLNPGSDMANHPPLLPQTHINNNYVNVVKIYIAISAADVY